MPLSLRTRVVIGNAVWVGLALGAGSLLASPGVRAPLTRTAWALVTDGSGQVADVRTFRVEDVRGISPGAPIYADGDLPSAPLGHVVEVSGNEVRALIAGPSLPSHASGAGLVCLPPSRTLSEALALAVPPDALRRLGLDVEQRLARTVEQALLPGMEERLPAFFSRLDPQRDAATRDVVDRVGASALERLAPSFEGLTAEVTRAMGARLDLLDRVGLLWKVVRGDGEGLRRQLLPVAREAATRWWTDHSREVAVALSLALSDRREELRGWLQGPLWSAARDELLLPALLAERGRLAAEGEAVLRGVVVDVALAPGGGFRPRFASVLRTHLLGNGQALLLLAPSGDPR